MRLRRVQAGLDTRAGRLLAVAALALSLGGCFGRDAAETTGSIGPVGAGPEGRRAAAAELASTYDRDPGDAGTAIAYAAALRANAQNAQAVAVLQQTAIRNPKNMPVLAAYGKALADAGRLKEAADVLSRAHTPERPDWRILSVQGAIADQLGDFEGAQRYYQAALRLVPGEPSVLSNQSLSFALAKHLPQAEATLRQAAASPRADGRVRQNLALVLGLEGKLGEAEEVLKRGLPPAEAAASLQAIRGMISQPNSWSAIRHADGNGNRRTEPAQAAAIPARPALKEADLRR